MSRFDDILLFCEDKAQGTTVRLLEFAVQALRRDLPLASSVEPRAVGSKSNVKVRFHFARHDGLRAFAVRDRDFLERSLLDKHRKSAIAPGLNPEAWPLRRHCIESYLIEPAFLAALVPGRTIAEWEALLEELAQARRWLDLTRAALIAARFQMTRLEWPSADLLVSTRDQAVTEIARQCEKMSDVAQSALNESTVCAKLEALEKDFADDGPLAHRVDGRKLLTALGARLSSEGLEPKGGLGPALMGHAERNGCPRPLLDEVRAVLEGIVHALAP